MCVPGLALHAVPLIIEPDPVINNKAKVTIINNHGDRYSFFHEQEKQILEAVKKAYNHKETKAVRNKHTTVTGPYCYFDCIENIRYLASLSDVQKHIEENKLISRTPDQILDKRKEHNTMVTRMYGTCKTLDDSHESLYKKLEEEELQKYLEEHSDA